ncbi:hypothetical protein KIPB_005660 [Kipferlia bialata]|uniref:Uncharacterized protein n=1 Tax=Kipferlia bialata TaxID=797122 RepID=A0A9K3GHJ3_9EUKA|nr:hypothetical protein KIPB_005660 [Kipferlia bialata]|eukprot:g5660.t1
MSVMIICVYNPRVFKWGLFLVGLFNLMQFWAPSFTIRIVVRVCVSIVYGTCAANAAPNFYRLSAPDMLPVCLAYNSLMGTATMVIAPMLSGWISGMATDPENPTWPYVYLVVSVIAFLWWIANVIYLPATERVAEGSFDGLGGLMFTVCIASLVFGLAAIPMDNVKTIYSVLSILVCAVCLPLLFRHEARTHSS